MAAWVFGQFLVEHRIITQEQLGEAVRYMRSNNQRTGDVAVELGMLSRDAAEELHRMQRARDQLWGELAVEVGAISERQLRELLEHKRKEHKRIGDVLVTLGILSKSERSRQLAKYLAWSEAKNKGIDLPEDWSKDGPGAYLTDYVPRLALRVCNMRIRVAGRLPTRRSGQGREAPYSYTIKLGDPAIIEIGLGAGRNFAAHLVCKLMGVSATEITDELIADGMSEFLNMIAGATKTRFQPENESWSSALAEESVLHRPDVELELRTQKGRGLLAVAERIRLRETG